MLTTLALTQAADLVTVLADGSSSKSSGEVILFLLALGPAAGIGFYTMIFLRYRNTDKRYRYEHETSSEVAKVQAFDQLVDRVRGTQRRRIDGDNVDKPRERLGANTLVRRH